MSLLGGIGIVHIFILKLLLIQVVSSKIISLKDGEVTYEYDDSECLAKGASGKFYKGNRIEGDKTDVVAFKVAKSNDSIEWLNDEMQIYKAIGDYDSIPKFHQFFPETIDTNTTIVIELLGQNLSNLIHRFKHFSTITIMRIGLQILDTLEYIHKKGVIHYDIHFGNIAVGLNNDSRIYIFDFDMAKEYEMIGQIVSFKKLPFTYGPRRLQSPRSDIKDLAITLNGLSNKNCRETLLKFSQMSKDSIHDQPDYEAFRNVLRTELEKHKDEPNYDKFDWQLN